MFIEEITLKNGKKKYKYGIRYHDLDGKLKKATITLNKNNPQTVNTAQRLLVEKINLLKEQEKENKKVYFHKVATEWRERSKNTIKYSTYALRGYYVKKLTDFFPDTLLLTDITVSMIEDFINTIYYTENLSYYYVRDVVTALKSIYKYAKKARYINDISFLGDVEIKHKPQTVEDVKSRTNKFLDKNELKDCLKQLERINPRVSLLFEFMAHTGLRIGELLALRVQDYNRSMHIINVNGSMSRIVPQGETCYRGTPKNIHSVRDILLDNRCIDIINTFMLENRKRSLWSKGYKDRGYIFTTLHGSPYKVHYLNRVLKKVHIPNKRISTHIFRNTHISLLTELGLPIRAIMARVGHNNPKTTLEIYTHTTQSMASEIVDKLNHFIV